MKKITVLIASLFLLGLVGKYAQAADPMGLDIIPLDIGAIVVADVEKTYDPINPGRAIALTGTTAASPKVIINYFHSVLLSRGWKSVGVVSAQGALMVREDEKITLGTAINGGGGQYHTRFFVRLESVHLTPEGDTE